MHQKKNDNQIKLLLVPCSGGKTTELADQIYIKLQEDYRLEQQVEILHSKRRFEVSKDTAKDHQHPLVIDSFSDIEANVDIGRNPLKDRIRGTHLVLIEHLLTPDKQVVEGSDWPQTVSVNDHLFTVRGLLDIANDVDTLQKTLVAPYLTYVRSHSIEKYKKRGFFQFNSLRKVLKDLSNDDLKALLTIDPHSNEAIGIANDYGMDFHAINPFQSGRSINPYKLGFSGNKAKEAMKKLRPFHERFTKIKEENPNHIYVISVDDGTERRSENFTDRAFSELSIEEVYSKLVYFDKDRVSYGSSVTRFKHFSQINDHNFDKEGTYIIIDDMFASGGTAMKVAEILKYLGAKRVEVWTSHAVTMPLQYEKANDRSYIDKVVCLDTVPQSPELNVEFIPASADLLAAELYKVHQKLAHSRYSAV